MAIPRRRLTCRYFKRDDDTVLESIPHGLPGESPYMKGSLPRRSVTSLVLAASIKSVSLRGSPRSVADRSSGARVSPGLNKGQ